MLASCVVKYGAGAWGAVAKQMERAAAEDAEMCKEAGAFSTAACAAEFSRLSGGADERRGRRGSAGAEASTEARNKRVLSQLTLDRMGELESLIQDEEEELKGLEADIEALTSDQGIADEELIRMWKAEKENPGPRVESLALADASSDSDSDIQEIEIAGRPQQQQQQPPPQPSTPGTATAAQNLPTPAAANTPSSSGNNASLKESPVKSSPKPPPPATKPEGGPRHSPRKRSTQEEEVKRPTRRSKDTKEAKESTKHQPSTPKEPWKADFAEERGRSGTESQWKAWKSRALAAHQIVAGHRHANLFVSPVKVDGYAEVVRYPMDLVSLKKLVESGQESTDGRWLIRTTPAYLAALSTTFANAVIFNKESSGIPAIAKEMMREVMPSALEVLELKNSPSPEAEDEEGAEARKTKTSKARRATRSTGGAAAAPKRSANSAGSVSTPPPAKKLRK